MLAVGVEVDCKEGDVYWTDAAKGVIKKSKLDGTDMKNVINGECNKVCPDLAGEWNEVCPDLAA